MKKWLLAPYFMLLFSCQTTKKMEWPERRSNLSGRDFYLQAAAMNWKERDSFAVREMLHGNMPAFLGHFTAIDVAITDSLTGKKNFGDVLCNAGLSFRWHRQGLGTHPAKPNGCATGSRPVELFPANP